MSHTDTSTYTYLRAALRCPLCNREKETDLLVCWDCYHAHHIGRVALRPYVLAALDQAETDARAEQEQTATLDRAPGAPVQTDRDETAAGYALAHAIIAATSRRQE